MRSKSTYAKEYVHKDVKKDNYTYIPDKIKIGNNWFGKTTYGEFFSNPNPEYFAKKITMTEKPDNTPDYNRQYGTFEIMQKQFTKMILSPKAIRFAQPKYIFRLKFKAYSKMQRIISLKILILSHYHPSLKLFQPHNIHLFDLMLINLIILILNNKTE